MNNELYSNAFFSNSIKKGEFFYKLKFVKIENDDH